MVARFVWAWKNDEELYEVRSLLYPAAELDETTRRNHQQLAVNIVNTWKLRRCRIPHSILATADLVDAILHHDTTKNSASTIKAVYASALAKMVTSVCDLEQDSLEKRSMMEQATKVGMPEEWVQLRHAITHGQTPGLKALETAVKEAVPWMWGHFWKGLDGEDVVDAEALKEEMRDLLGQYRDERRAAITSKSNEVAYVARTSKAIHRACKQRRDGLRVLIDVLLNDNILLPSEKQSNLKFKALLIVWDGLLRKIAQRQPKIIAMLADALLQMLSTWAIEIKPVSAGLTIVSDWLHHLLTTKAWSEVLPSRTLDDLRADIAETCLLHKNECTNALLKALLRNMKGNEAETLRQLAASCENGDEIQEMDSDHDIQDALYRRTGWSKPVAYWIPAPIGA